MNAIAPQHRDRLVKYLGLTGSSFDGERAAAALKAHELMQELKLSWDDVIVEPRPQSPILQALRHFDALTLWEQQFISSVRHAPRLSPKQRMVPQRHRGQSGSAGLAMNEHLRPAMYEPLLDVNQAALFENRDGVFEFVCFAPVDIADTWEVAGEA